MTAPRFKGDPPTHFASPLLEDAGVPHLFTTRHFPGVTAFRDPHPPLGDPAWPLLDAHGLARSPAAFLKQAHGAPALLKEGQGATVSEGRAGGLAGEADAIVTDMPGLPVAVFSADCVPLLLYDPDGPRLAAVHAGWRGTVHAVVRAAVHALVETGARPERLLAAVGPSIGTCCFAVSKPVVSHHPRA